MEPSSFVSRAVRSGGCKKLSVVRSNKRSPHSDCAAPLARRGKEDYARTSEPLETLLVELMNYRDDQLRIVLAVERRSSKHGTERGDEQHEVGDGLKGRRRVSTGCYKVCTEKAADTHANDGDARNPLVVGIFLEGIDTCALDHENQLHQSSSRKRKEQNAKRDAPPTA